MSTLTVDKMWKLRNTKKESKKYPKDAMRNMKLFFSIISNELKFSNYLSIFKKVEERKLFFIYYYRRD